MFYFEQLLRQGLEGIGHTGVLPAVIGIGYAILLVSFLVGLYQAALGGGDLQALAASAMKYLMVALILANWSWLFGEVNRSFNQIAEFIAGASGAGDMFLSWMDQLRDQFRDTGFTALLPAISGTMAAITTALLCLAAYLIYAAMVVVFAFFYVLYGCLLYVTGPLVLALLPIAGVGQMAKGYAINLMVWNAWGILYATFGSLITAIEFNRVEQVMNRGFLTGIFAGTTDTVVLGLVSVFYALALGLIPFMAKRLIEGEVGLSAYALLRAGSSLGGAVRSAAAGFEIGLGASSGMGSASSLSGTGSAVSAAAVSMSSSLPPPAPSLADNLRSGLRSAVGEASPPPAPKVDFLVPVRGLPPPIRPAPQAAPRFGPVGVTEAIAFHAGRLAGAAIKGERS